METPLLVRMVITENVGWQTQEAPAAETYPQDLWDEDMFVHASLMYPLVTILQTVVKTQLIKSMNYCIS